MEKIYTNAKLVKAWQRESRGRSVNMWWFDLDEYKANMKLDGESPIICNEGPIEEDECWNTLKNSTCMLLLRNKVKTTVIVVHAKTGGIRFYSRDKASFNPKSSIEEEAPGVFVGNLSWEIYAQQGLVKSTKKCLYGSFKPEAVFINPKVKTLVDWDIVWVMERMVTKLGGQRVQNILNKGGSDVGTGHGEIKGSSHSEKVRDGRVPVNPTNP